MFAKSKAFSLAERRHVSFSPDAKLFGIEGAHAVVNAISSRRIVTKLTLAHNCLGDNGCTELFEYLCSADGRRYPISEIDLHTTGVGDRALSKIARYLESNTTLKVLSLQHNDFGSQSLEAVSSFVTAINQSRLRKLILSSFEWGELFVPHILDNLNTPYLHELGLAMTGLSFASAPSIVAYLTSPRCNLKVLRLSANKLGYRGMRHILYAMEHNYSLVTLELHGNLMEEGDLEEDNPSGLLSKWRVLIQKRNAHFQMVVEIEALSLLRHSRILLLGHEKLETVPSPLHLPMELQLHVLSFLAPSLSESQRLRVFNYASSTSTLPPLLPPLIGSECLRDPAALPMFPGGLVGTPAVGACESGKCMGSGNSVICRRETARSEWLMAVGCHVYIPEPSTLLSLAADSR